MSSKQQRDAAPADDLVVDPLAVVAEECRMSIATLRREIARGRGPKITHLSERRQGVQRRHRREWLDARSAIA
jgi:hypothetical protein